MKDTVPKGILIPIGGREDREKSMDILCRLIAETGKTDPKICLITLATDVPERVADIYKKAFESLNITYLSIIHFNNREDADTEHNLSSIKEADLVLFSGGKQLKLTNLLMDTNLLAIIKQRYYDESRFVIAGTSAGAVAMSKTMIASGSSEQALIKGALKLNNGFDLIDNVTIDTHFIKRGRIGRLIQMVTSHPELLGLGLGEDTGVIITNDLMEVCGSGLVIIVDGSEIDYSDSSEIENGKPITVEGIKVHVLGPGKKFVISERKITIS